MDIALAVVPVLGFAATAFNIWLTARIRADVSDVKVWTLENFVQKADMRSTVQTYLSQERTLRHAGAD